MSQFPISTVIRHAAHGNATAAQKTAIVFEDDSRSFAELDRRVGALAAALHARGLTSGGRVAFLLHNRIEYVEAFLAVTDIGAAMVPVNYLLTPPEIRVQLEHSDCSWFIVSEQLRPLADDAMGERTMSVIQLDGDVPQADLDFEALVAEGATLPAPPPPPRGSIAQLQFTSGTTGEPKAVIHSHETILWNAFHQLHDLDVTDRDTYLCVPALCWSAGMHGFTLATLWAGGTVVLHPSRGLQGDDIVNSLHSHAATKVVLVPAVMQLVLDELDRTHAQLPHLKLIASGSSPVPQRMLEHAARLIPNAAILQAYGASEFPTIASILTPDKAVEKMGSAGRATSVATIRIVDTDGYQLPPGEHGEIVLQSPALALGYLCLDDQTDEAFRDGWYHSGDRGYLDEEGYLFVSGRIKDMIITGGLNVYPAEVEQRLMQHPGVHQVAVVGTPDDRLGEISVAVVHPVPGVTLDQIELREFLAGTVAKFKMPAVWWLTVDPLPATATGKLHKPSIRSLVEAAFDEGDIER